MRAGDLLELINDDSTVSRGDASSSTSSSSSRGTTESRDTSRGAAAESRGDVELLYGRNVATGDRGSFPASSVYILSTIDRPSPDFIVSKLLQ